MSAEAKQDHLTLKWGTLKSWNLTSPRGKELIEKYRALGSSFSAMSQNDTAEQKYLICQMIDECNDPEGIYMDWDGCYATKDAAKKYVLGYGKKAAL